MYVLVRYAYSGIYIGINFKGGLMDNYFLASQLVPSKLITFLYHRVANIVISVFFILKYDT